MTNALFLGYIVASLVCIIYLFGIREKFLIEEHKRKMREENDAYWSARNAETTGSSSSS